MKKPKHIMVWGAAAALMLSACSQEDENVDVEPEEENTDTASQVPEEDEEPDSDEVEDEEPIDDEEELPEEDPEPRYTVNSADWSLQPIDDAPEEAVLITIDDAPDGHGPEMAEILHDLDVRAIFFVNGHFIDDEQGEEDLLEIIEYGHVIGNHTMGHQNLSEISEEEQYDEIVGLSDRIEDITSERPDFFRAPHGVNTDYSWQVLDDENMVGMNWTYGYDWEADYLEAEPLADIMVETEYLRNGANLLMHDREHTKDALEDIILGLEEKGYEFIDPLEIDIDNAETDE